MILKTKLFGHVYQFKSVKEVLAKANEVKSGDELAGLAAANAEERVAAKVVLSELTLADLRENPVVPYESDEVTRIIQDDLNEKIYSEIRGWTVSDLREWLLLEETDSAAIRRVSRGLTSEMIAAVAKLMSNLDLIYGAKKIRVTAHCNTTIASRARFPCACSLITPPMIRTASWRLFWRGSPTASEMRSSASILSMIRWKASCAS